jgi:two-component system, NarL family, invasion response regulator UvrY
MFSRRPINIVLKVPFMISVLVIDDHPVALQGCRRVLEDAGFGPIYCASAIEAAHQLFLSHRPDVTIVDLALAGDNLGGLGFIRRIRASAKQTSVLVFSMHDNPAIVAQALDAGASGYVLKDAHCEDLIKAVRRISTSLATTCADRSPQTALNDSRATYGTDADAVWQGLDTIAPYVD